MKIINEVMSCRTALDDGSELIYKYYITEDERKVDVEDKSVEVKGYGICAETQKLKDGKMQVTFKDSVECINPYKKKVVAIIGFLARNEVSPIHLVNVIGEKVDDMVCDFDVEARKILEYNSLKNII